MVLPIFLDTQGPQITEVFVTGDPAYDLFDPKPSEDGPTPLVNSLTIDVQDLPVRVAAEFLYPALVQEIAEHPGHYQLVGDANGIIPIDDVIVTLVPLRSDGADCHGYRFELVFDNPLPDDRFTLTVSDALIDPVCNNLDGESNADEPQEDPLFPTGDGVPGGDFVARFTVDYATGTGRLGRRQRLGRYQRQHHLRSARTRTTPTATSSIRWVTPATMCLPVTLRRVPAMWPTALTSWRSTVAWRASGVG